ncbi:MAG: MFS transporter [Chloroflexi bacterium]|nr:MFS transporter [Chloroflexota bacterium]
MAEKVIGSPAVATQPAGLSRTARSLESMRGSPIFETLQNRDFRWILIGSFASFMGMNMQMITRGWLVLRLQDDSPLALVLVMVSFAAPMTFVSLIGGAFADRVPKKYLIIVSQLANALLTLILAMMDASGTIWFGALLIIGVINGSMMAINMPSRQAIISEIVPDDRLMNAVALNNSAMNLTRILGPALAGFMILFVGTSGVFYLVSVVYVLSALSVMRLKVHKSPGDARPRKSVTADITEGLRYVFSDQRLRGLTIMAFLPSLFGFTLFALMPAWAREALNVNAADLGLLMTYMGIGALVGTLGIASMRKFNKRGMLLLFNGIFWGIALMGLSQSPNYLVAIPFLVIIGLLSSVFMSMNMTLMQLYSAPEMRGRVMSIAMMTFGMMPIGALPFGTLAEYIGTPNALTLSGLTLAVLTLVFVFAYPSFKRIS